MNFADLYARTYKDLVHKSIEIYIDDLVYDLTSAPEEIKTKFRPCECGASHPMLTAFHERKCICDSYLCLKTSLPNTLFTKAVGHGCARIIRATDAGQAVSGNQMDSK
jgi:hypothetical protein